MILPDKILYEALRLKSANPSGYTIVGFIAYYHDTINKTSPEVFGNTKEEAIENLKQSNPVMAVTN
jgi:hypothetical protein